MRDAHAFVRGELEPMSVEAFISVAECCQHRRNLLELVQHLIDVDVACVHYQIDAAEHLENSRWQVFASFRNVSISDESYSHFRHTKGGIEHIFSTSTIATAILNELMRAICQGAVLKCADELTSVVVVLAPR